GSRRVAALFAAWTVQPGASWRIPSATGVKAASCSPRNSSPGSSAVAKWVQTPAISSCSSAAQARASSIRLPGSRSPSLPMPLSNLRWTAAGRPISGATLEQSRRKPSRQTAPSAWATGPRPQLPLGQGANHQDRRLGEVEPKLLGLEGSRNREAARPAAQRGGGAEGGTVSIAVRLDHPAQI